jgi:ribonuclease P protein component
VRTAVQAPVRVGLVVPRYKHSAVDRNTLKRRLREIVRLEWLAVPPPIDVVLRVTPPAYERDFDALQREMRQLLAKLLTAWPRTD